MKTRTRLRDIATELNISTALVSGVLNERANVWASEETRERIFRAAREMNYQPNRAAQNLIKGKSGVVALVYRRLTEAHFRLAYSGLIDVLSQELQLLGLDLVIANFGTEDEVLRHLEKLAADRSCDAVILWGREADTEPQAALLEERGIPFLVKGRHEVNHPEWAQIDFDHEGMMFAAMEHLSSLGHERIGYLGFPFEEGFVKSLRSGFEDAHLQIFGVPANESWLGAFPDAFGPNHAFVETLFQLSTAECPTGFVIGSGNAAWQALEVSLASRGRRLGSGQGDFAAAGVSSLEFKLLYGEAHAFQGIEIDRLAESAGAELLRQILASQVHEPIRRFLPCLTPANSLRLPLYQSPTDFGGSP